MICIFFDRKRDEIFYRLLKFEKINAISYPSS
jgi:hypothetical protein